MGVVEDSVDAAAHFIGPFIGKSSRKEGEEESDAQLVDTALSHLQTINAAEQAADPNAPYDGSLVGVVYGLLDLITSLGILPHLSPGVVFGQRPQSVLVATISIRPTRDENVLSSVTRLLLPILEQNGTGVQPLLSQRVLPDIISALAELSFSPQTSDEAHRTYEPVYERTITDAPTSRLLPVLTSLIQHDVPPWWKSRVSKELATVPLRPHGVRHTVEFLSLSYLSKNSQVPQDASGPQAQIPLPLEAIAQASRLLSSIPSWMTQEEWFTKLAPQLLALLDGAEGKELSRASGQIIAGGILNKKSTGAPKTAGWELFARPLQKAIYPEVSDHTRSKVDMVDQVLVNEQKLRLSLRRLATIASSYSYAGLLKRLIGPVVMSLWGLITYASSRPSLDKEWFELCHAILLRYFTFACEPRRVDTLANNLFWDGDTTWTFGPGSQGGIEIRRQSHSSSDISAMKGIISRMGNLEKYINLLVTLLAEAEIEDAVAGTIFVQSTKRWLSPSQENKTSLTNETDTDPLLALTNAKLSEALANKFKDKFVRSPQHVIELMGQLLQSFVDEHRLRSTKSKNANKPSRATLANLTQQSSGVNISGGESEFDDLATFALSILNTLVASPDFKPTPESTTLMNSILPTLQYLTQPHSSLPIPHQLANAATNMLQVLRPTSTVAPTSITDPLLQHREALKTALKDLTSPEPPHRAWSLSTLRKLINDPSSFPVVDVPSLAHAILSASIADPETYVHTAAMPVLVDLATHAPNPTVRIIVDSFTDVDERSLRLKKEKEIEEALDFRLRVGEVINNLILDDAFWISSATTSARYSSLKSIVEATLSLASRRGARQKTLDARTQRAVAESKVQEEGEAAWGGPIPNLLDPDADNPAEQAERDSLLKIVQGWENTGIEEDVRIRASALSILGNVFEKRLDKLKQIEVDAALQIVTLILAVETSEAKGLLRRAAVLVIMGLLKGMDVLLDEGKESAAALGMNQMNEVERVIRWVGSEDADGLVRDHAGSVVEGLETWKMKKLYRVRDEGVKLGQNLGLEELRGLDVRPLQGEQDRGGKRMIVEEIE
ncbi:hypothetical protein P280DRAFT_50082 [Massarina eburnea CBS 473.64]|uniref:RNA polymerase II assembly factor Rtp1 C-terminal domain-containing protein n=1 Tax=Massarina eburnea CBS 473.64 TaxID=1395130 RepID=A0A6A6RWV0_9PLEO|nr:hypothetical protein P280DRAFT_50082 [Massarina eburnea CBS 473.64]